MDTVADFLTRIRNAGIAKHEKVDVPSSGVRVLPKCFNKLVILEASKSYAMASKA